jgi:hypothetical protein
MPEEKTLSPDRIARQEIMYDTDGLTTERLRTFLSLACRFLPSSIREKRLLLEDPLLRQYLAPSDSLEPIVCPRAGNDRVLTIASSGEIPQAFIFSGSTYLEIVDCSVPACFMAELKLMAAQYFSYEDYLRLFFFGDKLDAEIFDPDIYRFIAPHLSAQARLYFDAIITKPELRDLFVMNKFSRNRNICPREADNLPTRFAPLASRDSYSVLQDRLAESEWTIRRMDLRTANLAEADKYDLVYISNVGYTFEDILDTVRILFQKGVKLVGFTIENCGRNIGKNCQQLWVDRNGTVYNSQSDLIPTAPLLSVDGQLITPGSLVRFEGIEFEVKHIDPTVKLGIYCEASSQF